MSASSVSNNNNDFISKPFTNNALINDLQSLIKQENYTVAVDHLIFYLGQSNLSEEKDHLYFFINELLPYHSESQFTQLCERLPRLLFISAQDQKSQYKLAIQLAKRFIAQTEISPPDRKLPLLINAMHYYAQALKIKRVYSDPHLLRECHVHASKIFAILLKDYLVSSYGQLLDEARRRGDSSNLKYRIAQLEKSKIFCCDEEDQREIFEKLLNQAIKVANSKSNQYDIHFAPVFECMKKERKFSEKLCTERYLEALVEFRKNFQDLQKRTDVESVQRKIIEEFRHFFKILIEDVITILGPPPCCFDVRAMGSIGRKESCPFSDLEFFILVENSDAKIIKYFNLLSQILELQIAIFGENPNALQITLSCLNPPVIKGLYIDQSPAKDDRLINTPENMACLQIGEFDEDLGNIKYTALKSTSLYTNNPLLYEFYLQEIQRINDKKEILKKRALQNLEQRKKEFKLTWGALNFPNWLNLKNYYVEFFIHLLTDLSLYYGNLEMTNPFELIQELINKGFFIENNKKLLLSAIELLYRLRIRLHLYYQQNKEEILINTIHSLPVTNEEIHELEKILWLILYPLYTRENILDFYGQDLVHQAFLQGIKRLHVLENPKLLAPLVTYIAKYLEEEKIDLAVHRKYYEELSTIPKGEILRSAYIDALQEGVIRNELAKIPNREGKRQQYRLNYEQLHKTIEAITIESKPQENAVKVVISYLNQTRYLHPDVAEQILDKGRIKSAYSDSLHHVIPLEWWKHSLHFKELPSHPLMEFAIHSLLSRIAGEVSAPTELVRFEGDKMKPLPVLISKTIPGKRLSEWNKTHKFSDLNKKQWTWLVLCTLLIKAGDGRLSNYIVDEKRNIFSIDNDVAFVEPVVRSGLLTTKVNFSSVLYLLSKSEDFLDEKVLKEFLALDHDLILTSWIDEVIEKEKQYKDLFSEEEKKNLYILDKNGKQESFIPTILFAPGALITLRLQWQHLKFYIQNQLTAEKQISGLELLKQIITFCRGVSLDHSVGEKIHRTYLAGFTIPLKNRLDWVTSRQGQGSLTLAESQKASLGKIPTIEEVQSGRFYPEQAKKELLATAANFSDHFTFTFTDTGGIALELDFKYLRSSQGPDLIRQDFVLRSLLYRLGNNCEQLEKVSLRSCDILNQWNILNFLQSSLSVLELKNISSFNDKFLAQLGYRCPSLKELYLSELPISKIGEKAVGLPTCNLEVLSITHCSQLKSVKFIQSEFDPPHFLFGVPTPSIVDCSENPLLQNFEIPEWGFPLYNLHKSPLVDFSQYDLEKHLGNDEGYLERAKHCFEQLYSQNSIEKLLRLFPPLKTLPESSWTYIALKHYEEHKDFKKPKDLFEQLTFMCHYDDFFEKFDLYQEDFCNLLEEKWEAAVTTVNFLNNRQQITYKICKKLGWIYQQLATILKTKTNPFNIPQSVSVRLKIKKEHNKYILDNNYITVDLNHSMKMLAYNPHLLRQFTENGICHYKADFYLYKSIEKYYQALVRIDCFDDKSKKKLREELIVILKELQNKWMNGEGKSFEGEECQQGMNFQREYEFIEFLHKKCTQKET